jgi:hypothetical protein
MDLTGKFVRIDVSGAVISNLFDSPIREDDARWTLIGEAMGETIGVGVWLQILGMIAPHEKEVWQEIKAVYLIRWEWVLNAAILPEKPKSLGQIGYRPQLPSES